MLEGFGLKDMEQFYLDGFVDFVDFIEKDGVEWWVVFELVSVVVECVGEGVFLVVEEFGFDECW